MSGESKNLWVLTEERPKLEVLRQILEKFANDNGFSGFVDNLRILPILENNKFAFTYELIGFRCNRINKIYIKTVSGYSSFVDFLVFYQNKKPDPAIDSPDYAIEETKTDDSESRNTGVYQRCSKFVYLESFYPSVRKIMLYNLQIDQKETPTETNVFGARMLLTNGVKIIGKKLDKKLFKPFSSVDELIVCKNSMRKPPKGNIPIEITIVLNDNLIYLIDMFRALATTPEEKVLDYIDKMVAKFGLSMTNTDGYIKLREQYNKTKEPLDLLILTFFSFNHQIRFNSDHKFNTPFGKNRSRYNANIKKNLIDFMKALHSKNIIFTKLDFDKFDFSQLGRNDFVYCDPPYLITVGTYNDGKRGFTGWSGEQEQKLLSVLDSLNDQKIKFALSNVLTHKDRRNDLLNNWVKNNHYTVHNINKDYANSNYQTSSRNGILTQEVLITNY